MRTAPGDASESASRYSRFLVGAWNFRDVVGAHNPHSVGMAPGRLFRSSTLSSLEPEGRSNLTALGITSVVDLRYSGERRAVGEDLTPNGISVVHRPFATRSVADALHEVPSMESDEQRFDLMANQYRWFVTSEGASAAIRTVCELLIDPAHRAVLVHCAAGKDRTGWVCAAVLAAAGAPRELIDEDFMASNEAIEDIRTAVREGSTQRDLSSYLVGVRPEYLQTAFGEVDKQFGSMDRYLDSIGLDNDMRRKITLALHM